MYSESDLQSAVDAGILPAETAEAFRNHVASQRATPLVDEENFRLLTGFNDIFVVIALALLLAAISWIGSSVAPALGSFLVAVASWGLAEFFTRRRRMALPSIVLLLTFVGSVASAGLDVLSPTESGWLMLDWVNSLPATTVAGTGLAVAIAAAAHWFRFRVPITIAAGAVAVILLLISLLLILVPALHDQLGWLAFAGGIALFALAMRWDMADRTRQSRRSDVAFWLHLAAAPMIAHPVFASLGVFVGNVGTLQAVAVVLLYALIAIVSLAIDRRALLVSSLAYVLYAISVLFETFGGLGPSAALTALVIGSALLLLSAFWHKARRLVMAPLPQGLKDKLPVLDRTLPAKTA
ncbi:hypothetical protein A8950_0231 [Dongia mobilis]|uniref:Uncharacterized protein n=1 Tax=Dongia mobilis TaxID=578943 RepID=A0A4R6WVZ9_9PROT|nr:hypothetical protein [Dongia mobilis]TDQ85445.1 hypothetical protein A8950_0231 [Dongia mobilis]